MALSLLFAAGERPDSAAVARLATAAGGKAGGVPFAIAHDPGAGESWLELVALGLTFDCTGLSPGVGAPVAADGIMFGLDRTLLGEGLEAVSLEPGPHLRGGGALLPVVRVLAGLGAALCALEGVRAVCWSPAGTWMEPGYFVRLIDDWLDGGAFPALGLTGLVREPDGALHSTGLEFLIGQELLLEPRQGQSTADAARIAVRLIHELVARGALEESTTLTGPGGEVLRALVSPGRRLVRVSQD